MLIAETRDRRSGLFCNAFMQTVTEYATWDAAERCNRRACFVLRVPNTIAPDERSGVFGARQLMVRDPEDLSIAQEPAFGISLVNDAGKWGFDRYGEIQSFEDCAAYKSRRVKNRFTDEMLLRYCDALGLPVYERGWYTGRTCLVPMQPLELQRPGLTYEEASVEFRVHDPK